MAVKPFSRDEDLALMEHAAAGATAAEMALSLGRTKNSIIGRCYRIGVPLTNAIGRPKRIMPKPKRCYKPKAKAAPSPKAAALIPAPKPALGRIQVPPPCPVAPKAVRPRKPITIIQLTGSTCRWPEGDPKKPSFGYCGARTNGSGPYCVEHHERAHA